jgi:hypothetical protein
MVSIKRNPLKCNANQVNECAKVDATSKMLMMNKEGISQI